MRVKETVYAGEIPVFQIDRANRSVQGGFILDKSNLSIGNVVPRGAVVQFDEATRKAKVLKTARLTDSAADDATDYKVEKGHLFAVGDNFGGKEISDIDTSNADYDTITVSATIGSALSAGEVVTDGSTLTDFVGLNYKELEVHSGDVEVTVLVSGTVYERRTTGIGATVGAKMPRIIRSQSY